MPKNRNIGFVEAVHNWLNEMGSKWMSIYDKPKRKKRTYKRRTKKKAR